jgi:murein DD-endopeptidase MepM/ murein hydrolase activator NlpD
MRDGQFAGYGDIQGAILETGKRRLTGVRFLGRTASRLCATSRAGRSSEFLKSPLSSAHRRFSLPAAPDFRQRARASGGIYAAPTGTPVSIAAGTVETAGWNGEAGRMVTVRHAGGYETQYLHLSALGPGIQPGARVAQGQLLGRVGMTGSATGPHLDYRIKRNGIHVNPTLERSRMRPGEPIGATMPEPRNATAC